MEWEKNISRPPGSNQTGPRAPNWVKCSFSRYKIEKCNFLTTKALTRPKNIKNCELGCDNFRFRSARARSFDSQGQKCGPPAKKPEKHRKTDPPAGEISAIIYPLVFSPWFIDFGPPCLTSSPVWGLSLGSYK